MWYITIYNHPSIQECHNNLGVGEEEEPLHASDDDTGEIIYFRLNAIQAATRKFSDTNKLGEGGFGSVYWVITKTISIYITSFFSFASLRLSDIFLMAGNPL